MVFPQTSVCCMKRENQITCFGRKRGWSQRWWVLDESTGLLGDRWARSERWGLWVPFVFYELGVEWSSEDDYRMVVGWWRPEEPLTMFWLSLGLEIGFHKFFSYASLIRHPTALPAAAALQGNETSASHGALGRTGPFHIARSGSQLWAYLWKLIFKVISVHITKATTF